MAASKAAMAAWYAAKSTGGFGKVAALSNKPFREPLRSGLTCPSDILASPISARIFFGRARGSLTLLAVTPKRALLAGERLEVNFH